MLHLRIPHDTLLLITEKWVNENLASPLRVTGVRLDAGCDGGPRDLMIELERGDCALELAADDVDQAPAQWSSIDPSGNAQMMAADRTEWTGVSHVRVQQA